MTERSRAFLMDLEREAGLPHGTLSEGLLPQFATDDPRLDQVAKWTLTLAIALIFYLQSTFLPPQHGPLFAFVVMLMAAAAVSVALGVLAYARATKVLAGNAKATFDDLVRTFGFWHSALLLAALAGVTP